MGYFRARLNDLGYSLVGKVFRGRNGEYSDYILDARNGGKAIVHMDQGHAYLNLCWGTNGLDIPLSFELKPEYIDGFELHELTKIPDASGSYVLRNRQGHILARALFGVGGATGTWLTVVGQKREDVVKLYESILAGEIAPESAGGRRGLVRSLRQQVAALLAKVDRMSAMDTLIQNLTEAVGEKQSRIDKLEAEIAELKKPKPSFFRSLLQMEAAD